MARCPISPLLARRARTSPPPSSPRPGAGARETDRPPRRATGTTSSRTRPARKSPTWRCAGASRAAATRGGCATGRRASSWSSSYPARSSWGSPEDEPGRSGDEGPQHRVLLTRAFYLGATEVTQGQWRRVTGEDRGFFPDDRKPADGSWDDLQSFLARANDGLPAEIEPLRAPTEGEWEYACRAGTGGPFAFDAPVGHGLVNHNDGVVDTPYVDGALRVVDGRLGVAWEAPPSAGCRMTTVAAGSLPPNPWGLHEMHGNLWEWTADGYSTSTYARRGATAVDPFERPEAGGTRTLRGGSWYGNARFSRSAARDRGAPSTRSNRIGFRVARTL
ncbi:MAG: formylglycine-generating enzyme family protein [Planctomycetota bacterium]